MLIQTNSGDYIDLDAIEDSRLPPKEENYKQTANEFYGKDRPKKPKQDKVYSIFQIQKILRERYNLIFTIDLLSIENIFILIVANSLLCRNLCVE